MKKAKKASTKRKSQQGGTETLKKRELTEEEQARLEAYREWAGQTRPLKFKSDPSSKHSGGITAADPQDPLIQVKLAEALGTTDPGVQGLLFDQVVQSFSGVAVVSDEHPDGFNPGKLIGAANSAAALLAGIGPRDELEAMLAVQMIAVHNAAMDAANRAILTGQKFDGRQANMGYVARLMQIFTSQLETFKKYRTGGQQKMVVEHVHVHEGGQAVVGPVSVKGGAVGTATDEPHAK